MISKGRDYQKCTDGFSRILTGVSVNEITIFTSTMYVTHSILPGDAAKQ